MIPELKALEPQLKEILYNCVEHVKATKAALYLSSSEDLNAKTFEIITSYQYNPADRKVIKSTDDLVDRLSVRRNAFFVNGLAADQRFAEMQFRQGTDRLLVTPLFSRGRLLGFIDMRDKAGKQPFENPDLDAAKKIGDEVIGFLSTKNLFGLAPVALVETTPAPAHEAAAAPLAAPGLPRVTLATPLKSDLFSPAASHAIAAAHEYMTRRQHAPVSERRILTDADLEIIHLLLPSVLAIPHVVLAAFTAIGHVSHPQAIVATATVSDEALEKVRQHLRAWLEQTKYHLSNARPAITYPIGVPAEPLTAAGINTMLSAPVSPQSIEGLILTIACAKTPEWDAQRALEMFLRQIEQAVETTLRVTAGRTDRYAVGEKLLEPEFQKFPELALHGREIAKLAQRFAKVLGLPTHQCETIRVAALVHDVGMRLLDYDRLYRKQNMTPEELRGIAEHPVIGAALVEPLLGSDVAQIVLRHHERVDGKGYPSRLLGTQIPLGARMIQICDAWVAMTSSHSYQKTVNEAEAMARLREGAGAQFDPQLVEKFLGSLNQIADR